METNDERRKRRLSQLCELHGGVREVAAKAGLSWATLDQILKGALLPEKSDGTRSPRALGDENARAIEKAYGLAQGWFDWPFEAVEPRLYYGLSEVERGFVQGAMSAAIREIAERKARAVMRIQQPAIVKPDSSETARHSGTKKALGRLPGELIRTGQGKGKTGAVNQPGSASKKRSRGSS